MAEQFENNYETTLDGAIDSDDTTITVHAAPVNMTGQFRIKIDSEIILVGAVSGLTFTGCTRGVEDTTAASHSDNAPVTHVLTAAALLNVFDSIDDVSPNPTSDDDEFSVTDTSDPMTGWTTLGTPTAHNISSTILHNYYVSKNAGSLSLTGIYKAIPSMPFTVTMKYTDFIMTEGNARAQLFIGEATPGDIVSLGHGSAGGFTLYLDNWTSPTSYGSVRASSTTKTRANYVRFVVTSSTDVTAYISNNGYLWEVFGSANFDPGFTIGSVGLCIDPNASGGAVEAAFDWIRFGTSVMQQPGRLVLSVTDSNSPTLDSYLSSSGNSRNDEFNDGPSIDGKWALAGNALDDVDENNDYPDKLLLRRNDTGSKISIYYQDLPTLPCDIYAKVSASTFNANYCRGGGIAILPATPSDSSAAVYIGFLYNGGQKIEAVKYSDLSTFSSTIYSATIAVSSSGIYLRATILTGGTTADLYWSNDGHFWIQAASAYALGFTAANAGIGISPEGQTTDAQALFDAYRVS